MRRVGMARGRWRPSTCTCLRSWTCWAQLKLKPCGSVSGLGGLLRYPSGPHVTMQSTALTSKCLGGLVRVTTCAIAYIYLYIYLHIYLYICSLATMSLCVKTELLICQAATKRYSNLAMDFAATLQMSYTACKIVGGEACGCLQPGM